MKLKKIVTLLLALSTVISVAACGETAVTSSENVSSTVSTEAVSSQEETSSAATSSEDNAPSFPVQTELTFEYEGITYYNVTAAAKGKPATGDDDQFFPEDAEGYYIEKGVYQVSADVFDRIYQMPFLGDGAIKWNNFSQGKMANADPDLYDGKLWISRMNDPLYVYMCRPNEQGFYMGDRETGRRNAQSMGLAEKNHTDVIAIGALYNNLELEPLPADTEITVCFGSIKLLYKMKGMDWYVASDLEKPGAIDKLYPLPWELEKDGVKAKTIDARNITKVDDHYEVKLKAGDLRRSDDDDERITEYVFHFWGKRTNFPDGMTGADLEAVAVSYSIWVKEEEFADYLTATVGADIRGNDIDARQLFTGHSYKVTTEPRIIFGHNVGPNDYDIHMDTEKVQELLDLK